MSQALRKLTGAIARTNTAVIFVNQLREKVGIVFGNPEVTPGGRALKFYSSVRIDIRRVESIKQGQQVVGNRVRTRIVKNKVAPPYRVAEFDMLFSGRKMGISREGDILDMGVEMGVLKKQGSFFSYGELRLGQGRENARAFLIDNPQVAGEIEARIRSAARAAARSGYVSSNGASPGGAHEDEEDEGEV
jgi:recombination protein RecA